MKQPIIYHYSVQIGPLQLFVLVLPPDWDAKVALGQDKQRKLPFKIMYAFCWSCLSANFVSQHGGFVPRVWQAAKGLYLSFNHCLSSPPLPQLACSVKYGQL